MTFTTQAISSADHHPLRPEFIRLPKPGTCDSWTGLSRSTLNVLVLPCRENGYRPPVRSCSLRRKGLSKGVRLIDFQSLLDHINAHPEPSCAVPESEPESSKAEENAHVLRVGDGESLRLIISVRVERDE
jgi:hypothetical protein